MEQNHWIMGGVRSGKTNALVEFARQWYQTSGVANSYKTSMEKSVLLIAMNGDNRRQVTQKILAATAGALPLRSTTPLGFFEEEVMLFWPLVIQQIKGTKTLPLRLRPESEQYLAVQFWGAEALEALNGIERFSTERWARNLLDVIQLAAFSGTSLDAVPTRLQTYWEDITVPQALWSQLGQMVLGWRDWCLNQGFLTYGLVTDLFWNYLLPLPEYQAQLENRYQLILADDVESYPAIARHLFEQCSRCGIEGVYTANPEFSVRLGLGADPDYLRELQNALDCHVMSLPHSPLGLGTSLWPKLSARLNGQPVETHSPITCIRTITRSQLLRQTADFVIDLVESQDVNPSDIAILGPGLDALARYALTEIIEAQNIPVISLKEQRSLHESALVRSLLTLLVFIYEGFGRWIDQDSVTEMLGVMTGIDPVRAGLLADYCFKPDLQQPELLPLEVFPRWDRVGSLGAIAYRTLRSWIQHQRQTVQHKDTLFQMRVVDVLSEAIAFFWSKQSFRYDQTAVLRELLETAQHFDDIGERQQGSTTEILRAFMRVVRQGMMVANPYPVNVQGFELSGITLSTAYQYRIARLTHPYHFWLDIGSSLWQQGSLIGLWGAFSFLQNADSQKINARLDQEERIMKYQIKDLSSRVKNQVVLCYSELSVSGQEQMGALTSLIEDI